MTSVARELGSARDDASLWNDTRAATVRAFAAAFSLRPQEG